jgi:hypothetical protein
MLVLQIEKRHRRIVKTNNGARRFVTGAAPKHPSIPVSFLIALLTIAFVHTETRDPLSLISMSFRSNESRYLTYKKNTIVKVTFHHTMHVLFAKENTKPTV